MQNNHSPRSRRQEAMRLITLARGMLASEGDSVAVTHLDLAFNDIFERHQAEAKLDCSPPTVLAREQG